MKELDYFLLELSFNDNIRDFIFIKELKKSIANCKFTINELLEYSPNKDVVLKILDPYYEEFLQLFYYKKVANDLNKLESIFLGMPISLRRFALLSMTRIFPDELFLKHFILLMTEDSESVYKHLQLCSDEFNINYQLYFFKNINNLFKYKPDLVYFYVNIYHQSPSEFKRIQFDKLDSDVLLYLLNTIPISVFEPFYFHLNVSFKKSKITKDDFKKYVDLFMKSIKNETRLESFRSDRDAYVFRATMRGVLSVFYNSEDIDKIMYKQ